MKRVVGLPGESVGIIDGRVIVNGDQIPMPKTLSFLKYYAEYGLIAQGRTYQCTDGYFVLGDDTDDSQDSRFEGELAPDRIRSRAWLVIWPPKRIGFLTP